MEIRRICYLKLLKILCTILYKNRYLFIWYKIFKIYSVAQIKLPVCQIYILIFSWPKGCNSFSSAATADPPAELSACQSRDIKVFKKLLSLYEFIQMYLCWMNLYHIFKVEYQLVSKSAMNLLYPGVFSDIRCIFF